MGLARHIGPVRYRAVLRYWLITCPIIAASMLAPLAVALGYREWEQAAVFAAVGAAVFAVGLAGRRMTPASLRVREGAVVTALSYLSYAVMGAIPYLVVAGPMDALFESMSGITTTGLSVVAPDDLPRSLLFFRSWSQWIGGAGIIILSVAVVFGTGRSVVEFHRAEFGDQEIIGSVTRTARTAATIYVVLTAVAIAALLATGAAPFDAINHGLTSISTGGFATTSEGDPYSGAFALALIPMMLLGATSLPLFYYLRTEGLRVLRRDVQPLVLLGFAGGLFGLVYALSTAVRAEPGDGAFHVVSALTTTGYTASDPNSWSPQLWSAVLLAMIVGGSSASTAGGLKLWRAIVAFKSAHLSLVRASLPTEAVTPLRYREETLTPADERAVLGYIVLYLAILAGSALIFSLAGFAPSAALFEAASALGTVGMSSGITSPELHAGLKAVLVFDMWAGRLEIVPVLLTLYHRTWWYNRESS